MLEKREYGQDNGCSRRGVYDSQQMGQIDELCAPYISTHELMENAGWAVAHNIQSHYPPMKTLVMCGPGNNGGDGFVTARYLKEAGWPVRVTCMKPPRKGSLSEQMYQRFDGPSVDFNAQEVQDAELIVDALFGAGLSRDIASDISHLLKLAKKVVAIDVPTGVDGTTGTIRGDAPHAEMTVTFCRLKPGHLLYPAKAYIGKVVLADIGTPQEVLEEKLPTIWHNHPSLWPLPRMTSQSNKYTRGVVTVCSGATMPGASLLASSAARCAGAGLVCLAHRGKEALLDYALPPGLVVSGASLTELLADKRKQVWVCGPGLTTEEVKAILPNLVKHQRKIVGDAGVFSAYAGMPEKLQGVSVITPHAGEFKRLTGITGTIIPQHVAQLARKTGAVTLLKGPSTVIASPDGTLCINTHATPALATAGSGDTLSGIIAALLATGLTPWESACAGAWLHGEAASQSGSWPVAEAFDAHIGAARDKATTS